MSPIYYRLLIGSVKICVPPETEMVPTVLAGVMSVVELSMTGIICPNSSSDPRVFEECGEHERPLAASLGTSPRPADWPNLLPKPHYERDTVGSARFVSPNPRAGARPTAGPSEHVKPDDVEENQILDSTHPGGTCCDKCSSASSG